MNVKEVIADLNAQLADPSRAGVENVKAELGAILFLKHHLKEVVDLFPVVDIREMPCVSICTEKPQGASGIRLGRNIVPTSSRDAQFVVRSLDSIASRVGQATMLPAVNGKWSAAIAINARSSDEMFSITSMYVTVSRPHPKLMLRGSLPTPVVDG